MMDFRQEQNVYQRNSLDLSQITISIMEGLHCVWIEGFGNDKKAGFNF